MYIDSEILQSTQEKINKGKVFSLKKLIKLTGTSQA